MSTSHNFNPSAEVSVVVTVLNEVNTIILLLNALAKQTLLPKEVIIVDGGSQDGTQSLLQKLRKQFKFPVIFRQANGNRSVGRNVAIGEMSTCELIAITDAGCLPKNDWLEKLVEAQKNTNAWVVAGYYQVWHDASNFQKLIAPFFLVMPDQIKSDDFLPATRSMLLKKIAWKNVGGFDEELSDNEDYVFARDLRSRAIPMTFTNQAIVEWQPPNNIKSFYRTIFRFARGDVQAEIFRPALKKLIIRTLLFFTMAIIAFSISLLFFFLTLLIILIVYSFFSIFKHRKHLPELWILLPIFHLIADLAILHGSFLGLKMIKSKKK